MANHHLILLRHGKSDWSAAEDDFSRPLNKRGGKSVPKIGNWLKKHGPLPERIVSSPAQRAWSTAGLMARALDMDEALIIRDERIYGATLKDLKTVIESRCSDANCVMIVGHNPGLDELLVHLSADPPPRDQTGKLMTTAAIAVLEYGEDPISSTTGSAELKELKRPKEL